MNSRAKIREACEAWACGAVEKWKTYYLIHEAMRADRSVTLSEVSEMSGVSVDVLRMRMSDLVKQGVVDR
jgi:hypothetical protein